MASLIGAFVVFQPSTIVFTTFALNGFPFVFKWPPSASLSAILRRDRAFLRVPVMQSPSCATAPETPHSAIRARDLPSTKLKRTGKNEDDLVAPLHHVR